MSSQPQNRTRRNELFYWDNITFQVEDEEFCIPRNEFLKSSTFVKEFLSVLDEEGQPGQPVLLQGCQKSAFINLLQVMYPSPKTTVLKEEAQFSLKLTKEEWLDVLKLSTLWEIEAARNYAVGRLSDRTRFLLQPIEKVLLGREHKVPSWIREGIASLVNSDPVPLEKLAILGWPTAAKILSLKDRVSRDNAYGFRLSSFTCQACRSNNIFVKTVDQPPPDALRNNTPSCSECKVAFDDKIIFRCSPVADPYQQGRSARGGWVEVDLASVKCPRCSKVCFATRHSAPCQGCKSWVWTREQFFVLARKGLIDVESEIDVIFREDLVEAGMAESDSSSASKMPGSTATQQ